MASQAAALAAVGLAGMFQGVAAYHLIGHPVPYFSSKEEDTAELLHEFRRVYRGSVRTQAPLSVMTTLTAATAAYLNWHTLGDAAPAVAIAFGVAALAQLAEGLYSFWKMMPLDMVLLNKCGEGAQSQRKEETRQLLVRWGRLHAVRVALSVVALGGCFWGIKLMLPSK